MKWCPKCKEFKPKKEFLNAYCPECDRQVHAEWYRQSDYYANSIKSLMEDAIKHYGVCECGENDRTKLVIFPSTGNGLANSLYHVRKHGFPPTFRVLCKVCAKKYKQISNIPVE